MQLSVREQQVAAAIVAGKSRREVAEELGIARKTVDSFMRGLFHKLRINKATQLAKALEELRGA